VLSIFPPRSAGSRSAGCVLLLRAGLDAPGGNWPSMGLQLSPCVIQRMFKFDIPGFSFPVSREAIPYVQNPSFTGSFPLDLVDSWTIFIFLLFFFLGVLYFLQSRLPVRMVADLARP